jgi:hypothetical protein
MGARLQSRPRGRMRGLGRLHAFPAGTSARATTLPGGSTAVAPLTMRVFAPPCAIGRRMRDSSTSTSCWQTSKTAALLLTVR